MDITEDQTPPAARPPMPDKGVPPNDKPDTGPKQDQKFPEQPEEGESKPVSDMDPDGQDPVEGEVVN
jgi:hypothetical protein